MAAETAGERSQMENKDERVRGAESHCHMLINITPCSVMYVTSKPSLSCAGRHTKQK